MAKPGQHTTKSNVLKQRNALHRHADKVTDDLFRGSDFFDRRDLVQVKYEMLRRVRVDGASVVQAAATFGLSRPSYYEAQAAFERAGLQGLLPKPRGPRRAHKLSGPVMAFVHELLAADASLRASDIVRRIHERFGVVVHPRSLERAIEREGKPRSAPARGRPAHPRARSPKR